MSLEPQKKKYCFGFSDDIFFKMVSVQLKQLTLLLLGRGVRTDPPSIADLAVISERMYQTTPNFLTFTINIRVSVQD